MRSTVRSLAISGVGKWRHSAEVAPEDQLKDGQVVLTGSLDRGDNERAVEGCQAAIMHRSQSKQVRIRDLTWSM